MTNKKWIVFFLLLIILSLTSIFIMQNGPQKDIAVIQRNGETIREIDLSLVTESYTFVVGDENGSYNTISVSKDGISVIDASCPDQVCVRHGYLKESFSPIVCLPNNLTIVLEEKSNIDALTR